MGWLSILQQSNGTPRYYNNESDVEQLSCHDQPGWQGILQQSTWWGLGIIRGVVACRGLDDKELHNIDEGHLLQLRRKRWEWRLKVTREKLLPRLEAKILREGTNCQTWVREEEAERKRLNYWSSEHNNREVEWLYWPRLVGWGKTQKLREFSRRWY